MKKISMLISIGVLSLLSYTLSYNLYANSKPQTCTWDNEYEGNKRTVTTRQVGSGGRDGVPTYESCSKAIARDRQAVERRLGNKHYNKTIDGDNTRTCSPNYTPPPCDYTPPKTALDSEPQTREVTVRQIGQDSEGNPCYESCSDAKRRAQNAWLEDEWGGHREDLEASIREYNEGVDKEVESSTQKAQKTAKKQKLGGMLAMGGAAMAARKAMACCAKPSPGPCCPGWWAVAAALGYTGAQMYLAESDNKKIAGDYSAGLMNDPDRGTATDNSSDSTSSDSTAGDSTSDSTGPTTTGDTTDGGATTGPGNTDHIGGDDPPPPITDKNGNPIPTTQKEFEEMVAGGGGEIDPNTGTITLPNGRKFSPSDIDKPEFQKHLNSPAMAQFNKDMAGLEGQIASAMGEDDLLEDNSLNGGSDSSDNMMAGGGGGFSGYAGAGRGGRGSAHGAGGMGRNPTSASDKDSKEGSNIAGMSVKRGKDRIGVSQDNIFHMIHRRYQSKRKKQHFIEAAVSAGT